MARFVTDGVVQLYYDNSKKFETNSNGVEITSGTPFLTVTASDNDGDATLNLVAKSQDGSIVGGISRVISESSSNSSGASAMLLQTRNSSNSMVTALRIDKDQDITLPVDNQKLRFGASQDLQIYHDGTTNRIDAVSGNLHIKGSNLSLKSYANETYLDATANGTVELYYDNSKKFETTSTGVTVFGDVSTGTIIQGAFSLRDTSSSSDRIKWIPNSPYVLRWADNFKASLDLEMIYKFSRWHKFLP